MEIKFKCSIQRGDSFHISIHFIYRGDNVTNYIIMTSLSSNSIYLLKPNILVQKEHVYRMNIDTNRQRYTYIHTYTGKR